jgi:D-glycero-alpha-D-manno-heptose-7-phosphate kinase
LLLGLSPVRLSFAGGGTDMPEFYDDNGGCVVSSTINHFTYVIAHPRSDNYIQIFSPDFQAHNKPVKFENLVPRQGTEFPVAFIQYLKYKKGINMMISSDVAPHSGLGSSSSLAVNIVNIISKLQKKNLNLNTVCETAHYVQRNVLKAPLGKQDEYICAFGGFNFITFSKNKIKVNPYSFSKNSVLELEKNLLLFYIGARPSDNILTTQINRTKSRDLKTITSLKNVKSIAETLHDSLSNDDFTKFGQLLHKGWIQKKNFSDDMTNKKIDTLYEKSLKLGALGGKLTGAGGGGHLLLYCEPNKQKSIIDEMKKNKIKHVPFSFQSEGSKILNLYDYTPSK